MLIMKIIGHFIFELTTEVSFLFIIVAKFNPSSIWKTSAFCLETTHFL